jgi:hypothetical protein
MASVALLSLSFKECGDIMDKLEQDALRDEWQRAQGMGKRLARERFVATLAGMGPIAAGFGLAVALWWLWPLQKIPIVVLGLPVAVSLPIGWWVRNKLWPGGQFR